MLPHGQHEAAIQRFQRLPLLIPRAWLLSSLGLDIGILQLVVVIAEDFSSERVRPLLCGSDPNSPGEVIAAKKYEY